jgi:DNA-directed RNA polymerase subunit RPC12/RpoP
VGRSSKDKNSEEHLRGLVRQLKSQVRNLKKQLSRSNKQASRSIEDLSLLTDIEEEWPVDFTENPIKRNYEPLKTPNDTSCVKCGKKAKAIDLGPKMVYACSNEECRHRRTVKNHGK